MILHENPAISNHKISSKVYHTKNPSIRFEKKKILSLVIYALPRVLRFEEKEGEMEGREEEEKRREKKEK